MPVVDFDFEEIKKFVGEDRSALKKMVGVFLNSTPNTLKELNHSLEIKDYDKLSYYAHKLKSSIDLLNIKSLKEEIRLIENSAKSNSNIDKLPKLIDNMNITLDKVIKKLKETI